MTKTNDENHATATGREAYRRRHRLLMGVAHHVACHCTPQPSDDGQMITLVVDREDEVGAFIITSLGHRPTQRLSFLGMQVADVVGQVGACLAPEVEDYLHRLVWSGRVVDGLTMLIAFDGAMLTTVRVEGDEVVVGGLPELPDLRGAAAN